jgi:diguanylate cyclase (GGDEF)-like protein
MFLDHKFQIGSRKQFSSDFTSILKKCENNCKTFGIIYFDIDDFGQLNKERTESVVDRFMLCDFISDIKALIEPRGFIYREGGDELICLIPEVTIESLESVGDDLLVTASSESYYNGQYRLTISCGITIFKPDDSLLNLQQRANFAKKKAKENGKNRVELE